MLLERYTLAAQVAKLTSLYRNPVLPFGKTYIMCDNERFLERVKGMWSGVMEERLKRTKAGGDGKWWWATGPGRQGLRQPHGRPTPSSWLGQSTTQSAPSFTLTRM